MNRMNKIALIILIIIVVEVIKSGIITTYNNKIPKGQLQIGLMQPISLQDLEEKEIYATCHIGASHEEWGMIKSRQEEKVLVVAANSSYDEYEQLAFIAGGFIKPSHIEGGSNIAVISDQLALRLFGTCYAVGDFCTINGCEYCVAGVYKLFSADLSFLLADDRERVYVPLTSTIAYKWQVDRLQCWEKVENALSKLCTTYNLDESRSIVYEISSIKQLLVGWGMLPWLFLTAIFLYEAIKRSWDKQKRALILWGISLLLIFLSTQQLYILPEALPKENLLSPLYYWEYFCKTYRQFHTMRIDFPGSWMSVYDQIRNMICLLSAVQIVGICVIKPRAVIEKCFHGLRVQH